MTYCILCMCLHICIHSIWYTCVVRLWHLSLFIACKWSMSKFKTRPIAICDTKIAKKNYCASGTKDMRRANSHARNFLQFLICANRKIQTIQYFKRAIFWSIIYFSATSLHSELNFLDSDKIH